MSKEVISISAIVDLMIQGKNISRENAEEYIRVLLSCVEDALIEGETVKVKGLGVFRTVWQDAEEHTTADEILSETGFYQIAFTPEDSFKNKVNEPFSHLEPVTIKIKDEHKESISEPEEKLDTFQLFEEQATEIKDLLDEIKALSSKQEQNNFESTDNLNNTINQEKDLEEENTKANDNEKTDIIAENDASTKDDNFEVVRIIYEDHPEVIKKEKSNQQQIKEEKSANTPTKNNSPEEQKENNISPTPTVVSAENNTTKQTKDDEFIYSEGDTNEDNSKKKNTLSYILTGILVVAIIFAFVYFLPFIKQKQKLRREKEQIERIADSLANEKRFIEIQDSIIRLQKNDSNQTVKEDSIQVEKKKPEPEPVKEEINTPSVIDVVKTSPSFNFTKPRKYNKFIATETMKVGSKLTKFARNYYGNANFWVYIYEANKDRIKDPNNIPAGAKLKIPKLDKRLIDIKNPKAIEYAKELQSKYLKQQF